MSELDNLRPEVAEPVRAVDRWMTNDPDWLRVRAELLLLEWVANARRRAAKAMWQRRLF